jgi:CheY-like chemotaxis protein
MTHTTRGLRPIRKVLVIDDEEAFCILLARMLSRLGYKVMTSTQAKSVHFDDMTDSDIIFIDMVMPGMDGLQVLQLLSSHQIKSEIVLMSGADDEILRKAESFARNSDLRLIGVLSKPFREIDVRDILAAYQHDYR